MGRFQRTLLPELKKQYEHGGKLATGRRKVRRPFDRKKPLHVVLRSDTARGRYSFLWLQNRRRVEVLLTVLAKKWQVRVFERAINSNHIHLLIQANDKRALRAFFRALSGSIAMAVTGAKKGAALLKRFWTAKIYTRIVEWGRAFEVARKYIVQNTLETLGVVGYRRRGKPGRSGRGEWGEKTLLTRSHVVD